LPSHDQWPYCDVYVYARIALYMYVRARHVKHDGAEFHVKLDDYGRHVTEDMYNSECRT
jgi:hypothetical protein